MKWLGHPMALYDLTREEQEQWLAFDAVEHGALRRDDDDGLDLLASRAGA